MKNALHTLYQNGTEEEQQALEELCRSWLQLANQVRGVKGIVSKYPEALEALQGGRQVIELLDNLMFARHVTSVSEAKM